MLSLFSWWYIKLTNRWKLIKFVRIGQATQITNWGPYSTDDASKLRIVKRFMNNIARAQQLCARERKVTSKLRWLRAFTSLIVTHQCITSIVARKWLSLYVCWISTMRYLYQPPSIYVNVHACMMLMCVHFVIFCLLNWWPTCSKLTSRVQTYFAINTASHDLIEHTDRKQTFLSDKDEANRRWLIHGPMI